MATISVSFSLLLLMVRLKWSGTPLYLFLVWNIFLAGLPYLISTSLLSQQRLGRLKLLIPFGIWLLFLPNAPYIVTDLIHIRYTDDTIIWYDIILVFSFALTGLLFYFISFSEMRKILKSVLGNRYTRIISYAIPFLCGFGIYLGRVLRWNSWDILRNPDRLLKDISEIFLHPLNHSEAWIMTLGFGTFLILGTWMFDHLRLTSDS